MGGQTALNTALDLVREGVLEKFGVELIGASREAIDKAEDREKFREGHARDRARDAALGASRTVMEEALPRRRGIGYPVVIRPSFTMGGSGGGIAYNREEFEAIVARGLDASPTSEVLLEESVIGWKEFEMEVVRDRNDNCIIVCSIENFDPMGVHTGDSITVAPAQTLTDKEYQRMRDASIAVLRKIGVETGGSNVQFAVNPEDGRLLVIEMNPRVSRSSALASKATGFPIARIAAKLAIGYTLDELKNDITGGATPASFEPSIDYVVTKIPRFTFEKFPAANSRLTTQMKSVGEVMAIGRTFQESLQKALRGLETGLDGLGSVLDAAADRGRRGAAGGNCAPPGRTGCSTSPMRSARAGRRERMHELTYASTRGSSRRSRTSSARKRVLAARGPGLGARRHADARDQAQGLLRRADGARSPVSAERRSATCGAIAGVRRSTSAWTPARPSSPRRRPTCTRPTRKSARRAHGPPQDHDPRRRPEPHRPGHRVRLLLRARLARAARGRLRDDHGQLQPGDGLHRLRHLRPPVFRAADARGRARGHRQGASPRASSCSTAARRR
jgi:carbamoylphosphate synthase large subunit